MQVIMKKSTLIATCLINCGSTYQLQEIETSISQTFKEDFPEMNYKDWNTMIPLTDAKAIIQQFGKGYRINVRQFIYDLI
jgi:hypothetical protein